MGIGATIDRAKWRLRNRGRSVAATSDPALAPLVEGLSRDGIVVTDAATVLGADDLYDRAAGHAEELYAARSARAEAAAGSKETFKTKLAAAAFDADDPFVEIAVHPRVLDVANGYLRLRSTLRALELWLTEPTPGPAIQTQLWHRDADDLVNVKLFLYFNDVTRGAGPFTYAPRTHPFGDRRDLPEHDAEWRSTDEQMAAIVPESDWLVCEGRPGTVVFADTCGYHKQLKPESDERLMLVAHYVSGTPYVPRALELRGVEAAGLTDDQYVAVFDRARG
jgi:Phytanoyl-CoA dioxygenase (PhyH)